MHWQFLFVWYRSSLKASNHTAPPVVSYIYGTKKTHPYKRTKNKRAKNERTNERENSLNLARLFLFLADGTNDPDDLPIIVRFQPANFFVVVFQLFFFSLLGCF